MEESFNRVADLLEATGRLGPSELREFVAGALAIRARREAPLASIAESELLCRINQGLPESLARRLEELIDRRGEESLTPEEHAELLRLGDEVELREASRLNALVDLAAVRRISLPDLMRDLGLAAPSHD
jgi:hypothetical protein